MGIRLVRSPAFHLALLSAFFFCTISVVAAHRQLWFDELFTFYVSRLETPLTVLHALLDKVEELPPVDFLLRNISMQLFGESAWAFRLPTIIMSWLASLLLYRIVYTRTSAGPALVAFTFPLTTLFLHYSHEGRAYSLLVAVACLALWAWQRCTEKPQNLAALGLLTCSLALGPLCHYYGILNYAPIVVGEGIRVVQRRKLSWPVLLSIVLSLPLLSLVVPFATTAMEQMGSLEPGAMSRLGFLTIPMSFYREIFSNTFLPTVGSLAIITVLASCARTSHTYPPPRQIPIHELGAAITFCLIPFMVYIAARLCTEVLATRYAIATIIGPALLMAYFTHCLGRRLRHFATVLVLSFVVVGVYSLSMMARSYIRAQPFPSQALQEFVAHAEFPVAVPDAHLYFKLYHYLPDGVRQRIYYVVEPIATPEYSGARGDEVAMVRMTKILPFNIIDSSELVRHYQHFFVIDSGNWLIKKLFNDGARISLAGMSDEQKILFVETSGGSNIRRHANLIQVAP